MTTLISEISILPIYSHNTHDHPLRNIHNMSVEIESSFHYRYILTITRSWRYGCTGLRQHKSRGLLTPQRIRYLRHDLLLSSEKILSRRRTQSICKFSILSQSDIENAYQCNVRSTDVISRLPGVIRPVDQGLITSNSLINLICCLFHEMYCIWYLSFLIVG